MDKTKRKTGIHLYKTTPFISDGKDNAKKKPFWHWHIVSRNSRIIARSSETYSSKRAAVKSIEVAAKLFDPLVSKERGAFRVYYDHSNPDCKLQSYL